MTGIQPVAPYRALISRWLIGYCLFFLIIRSCSGLLPTQLASPVLTNFHYDISMWLHKLSGLYRIVGEGWTGRLFNVLLFGFGIAAFIFPLERAFTIPFSILFFLLTLHFNYFLCHNSHILAGMVWMLPVLWVKREGTFQILWEGARYFACYVYSAAFVYKIVHGAAFQWDAGMITTQENQALYLFQNPDTTAAHIYYWFFNHPLLLNIGHKLVVLAEGIFLVGFFTKRWDNLLILLVFFIQISTFLFADVFFVELMVIVLPLLPITFWRKLWLKTVPASVHHLLTKEEEKGTHIARN